MVGENTWRFLALSRLRADPNGFLHRTAEDRDVLGRARVLGMVGEHEDRTLPRPAVRAGVTDRAVAVTSGEYGAGRLDVLLDRHGR